ncbi:vacuolar protein sorting-associated protein 16 homolog isoform X1 [Lathamus discolor]|uniref:vacuolar protein sorting-associated protein 16 homolog isoform X1 n=1 Tax=Lathamus discolor TaxID=678569 RepID=UPI0032B727DA
MDCYTANWNPLGEDTFYRKFELYTMEWNLKEDLRDCMVAAAPYGGPIALLKNHARKEKAPGARPLLEIFSSSGLLLASIPAWLLASRVRLCWAPPCPPAVEERAAGAAGLDGRRGPAVHPGGRHRAHLQPLLRVQAPLQHGQRGAAEPRAGGQGVPQRVRHRRGHPDRQPPLLPGHQHRGPEAAQDARGARSAEASVLLGGAGPGQGHHRAAGAGAGPLPPGQHLLLRGDPPWDEPLGWCLPADGRVLQPPVPGAPHRHRLHLDGAGVTQGEALRVPLQHPLPSQADGLVHAAPEPAARGGGGLGPAALGGRELQRVHPLRFVLDEDSFLVPELDGVRILSRSCHEFLQEIPEASQEIFRIASMAPGALLLEAQKEYEKESQKADEYLREIKDQQLLPEAVSQCIEAAGHEHEPDTQKSLLRAASFGKCFLDKFPPESFVRMCQDLRVLNAIRDYQIGIPLTFTQYKRLTIEVLLDRLVLRRLYPLAIRMCEYLRLSEVQGVSRILAHWACYKVQQKDKSDEEVAQAINHKLGDTPGISYSEIAARAYDCGRTELAIKLLEYEPRSGEQVPLLLKMKRSKLALSKAIESGDTDLVYTVVLHLKNELNRGTFFMTLQNQPVALSLYRQFCKHQERDTLKDLYNQDDSHQELGNFHVHASYGEQRIEGRVGALQSALDEFYKAKNEFAAKATEEQVKLLRLQRHLQEDLDKPYLDLSLHDTVSSLILDGQHKRAEQLYREFKIPDKRYWWLKISALANRGDWEEMEKFSKSKKSPIGYLPFVEIAVKHHNRYEAKKYAPRVPPEQRVRAFVLVGDLDQAADAAIEHKNETEMSFVLSKCSASTDAAVVEKLNRARAQLLKK